MFRKHLFWTSFVIPLDIPEVRQFFFSRMLSFTQENDSGNEPSTLRSRPYRSVNLLFGNLKKHLRGRKISKRGSTVEEKKDKTPKYIRKIPHIQGISLCKISRNILHMNGAYTRNITRIKHLIAAHTPYTSTYEIGPSQFSKQS
jgi:hypothetical protein